MIKRTFSSILFFLGAFCGIALSGVQIHAREHHVTVFVHGTVLQPLALASMEWFKSGEVSEDSRYASLLNTFRDEPTLFEDSPMLGTGMTEIPRSLIEATRKGKLSSRKSGYGCYYIISAYDALAQKAGQAGDYEHYALYGWSGMNSQSARQKAGYDLYNELCKLQEKYKEEYGSSPIFTIVAHSHGGNVALWLSDAEAKYKKGISIGSLLLFATPMQRETASFIKDPLFKSIISFSAENDIWQVADVVSTIGGQSFPFMAHVVDIEDFVQKNPSLNRTDVVLSLNDQDDVLDHFNLFMLTEKLVHENLGGFPLVVLSPFFVKYVQEHHCYNHIPLDIKCEESTVTIIAKVDGRCDYYTVSLPENLYETLQEETKVLKRYWSPRLRKVVKTIGSLYQGLVDMFSDGNYRKEQ
jgi:hypothetical protein